MKYDLGKDDILYFLHIPKTAGTTLISILDKYFPNKVLIHHDWQHLLPEIPIDFSKYQFVRGHFGYSIIKLFPKKPICITILRKPVATMVSSYKMSRRQPEESSRYDINSEWGLSELILKRPMIRNRQAHYVSADLDVLSMTKGLSKEELAHYFPEHQKEFRQLDMPEETLFKTAKKHLSEFAFVGLVEKMEESLFLLHYQFGWKPIRNIIKENVAPKGEETPTDEALKQLSERSKVDRKLYDWTNELFDMRYSQMIDELKQKYYEPRFDDMEPNDAVFEMLNKHYDEQNTPK